jgi:hypothetical protein
VASDGNVIKHDAMFLKISSTIATIMHDIQTDTRCNRWHIFCYNCYVFSHMLLGSYGCDEKCVKTQKTAVFSHNYTVSEKLWRGFENKYLDKNFWEELIAYFRLIRHGPNRKRRLKLFFVEAGTSLPSCCLATIRGYTDRSMGSHFLKCGSQRK